jgi:hypothetical protein
MIAGRRTSAMVIEAENRRERKKMLFFMWIVLQNENKQFMLPFFTNDAMKSLGHIFRTRYPCA